MIKDKLFLHFGFSGLSLISNIFLTRHLYSVLGHHDYANWSIAISLVSTLGLFNLGMGSAIRNQVAAVYPRVSVDFILAEYYGRILKLSPVIILSSGLLFVVFKIDAVYLIFAIFFVLNLFPGIFQHLSNAINRPFLNPAAVFLNQTMVFLILNIVEDITLLKVLLIYCGIYITINTIFFTAIKKIYFSSINNKENPKIRLDITLSNGFFFNQLLATVLNSMDYLFISLFFVQDIASDYNILSKPYLYFVSVISILAIKLWNDVASGRIENHVSDRKKYVYILIPLLLTLTLVYFVYPVKFFNQIFSYTKPISLEISMLFFVLCVTHMLSAFVISFFNGKGLQKLLQRAQINSLVFSVICAMIFFACPNLLTIRYLLLFRLVSLIIPMLYAGSQISQLKWK